ncbi:FixH family protein [Brumimicrobium mesophilum]|uniref:FixH family protein n=1 Tax=Brumimicrobium mesophilum TaxID=392717 RepID=UPI000D14271B|nr:FixH family protein [Brumimicrobium mesophilum]
MNWGKAIAIALIAFMSYIIYMVVILVSQDTDLVSPEYYKDEVTFEKEITAQQNAVDNRSNLNIDITPEGLYLVLETPDVINALNVQLYRSNAKNDDIVVQSQGKNLFIENSKLKKGRYYLTTDWEIQNRNYQLRDTVWIQ